MTVPFPAAPVSRAEQGRLSAASGKKPAMWRRTVTHADCLRRTAESAKGPVSRLVDFGLPENDHVGMRQHSGVFVSGASGFHRFILPKSSLFVAWTISRRLPNWKKASLINGLSSPPKRRPFFTSRLALGEGRSCGPATASRDRQFFRSGLNQASAVRKTIGQSAEFRLPQESAGVDGSLNGPGNPGTACFISGDSRPFAGDQRGHQAERYPAPDPDGSAYEPERGERGQRIHVDNRIHDRCRHFPVNTGHRVAMMSASRRRRDSSSLKRRSKTGRSASGPLVS